MPALLRSSPREAARGPSLRDSSARARLRRAAAALACAGLAGGACGAAAAAQLRPGLWNYSLQTRTGNGPTMNLAQMLDNMPPAARPQVEARLRQQGMSLSPSGVLQICLDARALAQGHPPLHLPGRCRATWIHADAADWTFRYHCDQGTVRGSGSLHIASDRAYSSSYTVDNGDVRVSGSAQAHWAASSCGTVPPLQDAH